MAAAEAGTAAAVTAAKIGAAASAASAATNAAVSMSGGHSARKSARKIAREQMAFNAQQAEKANRYNAEQAQIARKWQEDYYNNYESVGAQMRQRMEAGYNPYADASGGSAPSAAAAAPAVVPDASPLSGASSTISNSYHQQNAEVVAQIHELGQVMQQYLNAELTQAQVDKTKAEGDSAKADALMKLQQSDVFHRDLEYEDIQNMPGFSFGQDWYSNFQKYHGRKPKFGDLQLEALLKHQAAFDGQQIDESMPDLLGTRMRKAMAGSDVLYYKDPEGKLHHIFKTDIGDYQNPDYSGYNDLISKLMWSFMAEKDMNFWNSQNSFVNLGINRVRKNLLENGLDTSPNTIVGTILKVLFASNPDAFKNIVKNIGSGALNLGSSMSNPLGWLFDWATNASDAMQKHGK